MIHGIYIISECQTKWVHRYVRFSHSINQSIDFLWTYYLRLQFFIWYATLYFHISHMCTCSDIAHSRNVCHSAGCVYPNDLYPCVWLTIVYLKIQTICSSVVIAYAWVVPPRSVDIWEIFRTIFTNKIQRTCKEHNPVLTLLYSNHSCD